MSSCLADATKTAARAKSDCFDRYGIVQHTVVTYQPADRFWLFQAIEASIFAGLALALLAFSILWIRKRIS